MDENIRYRSSSRSPKAMEDHSKQMPKDGASLHQIWRRDENGLELQRGRRVSSYQLVPHFHDEYQLMFVLEGSREIRFGRDSRVFGAGTLTIVNPGEAHSTRCGGELGSSFRTMHIPVALLKDAVEALGKRTVEEPVFRFEIPGPSTARSFLAAHLACEFRQDNLQADDLLVDFVINLIDNSELQGRTPRNLSIDREVRLARDYIDNFFARELTLDEIAAAAGISKFHLVRKFKRAMRMPPHAYQIRIRLKYARRLLAQGMPIKQVAAEAGFADASHLGRWFRQIVGFTPAYYQRMIDPVPSHAGR
jgi:AraC-like DNA-binding protein/mannose-6-phosphate isomerase-like protein (cupin superfamily)